MGLINCKKVSDISIGVTKNQAITSSVNGVLFIEPIDSNYVLDAANFTNNSGTIANISGITLTNTTTAYAADNKVQINVDLLDSFSPSADAEFIIDIDGEATHVSNIPYTVAGSYAITQSSNITITPSATTYSNSGIVGQTETLFTLTFAAASGYYMPIEPAYDIIEGIVNEDNYTITFFDRSYTDGLLTSIKARVQWTYPAFSVSGHELIFSAEAESVPVQTNLITSFQMDDSVIPSKGAFRDITIKGSPGASFVLTATNITANPNTTYDFSAATIISLGSTSSSTGFTTSATNLTGVIPATGEFVFEDFSFPASTTLIEYSFNLQGGSSPSTNTLIGGETNNNPFTWKIRSSDPVTVFIGTESSNVTSIINSVSLTNNILLLDRGVEGDTDTGVNFTSQSLAIVLSGTKNLFVRRDPLFSPEIQSESDFSNSDYHQNGGMWWQMENLRVTGNGTSTLSILADLTFNQIGVRNVNSLLNLDNIINRAPVASTGITFNCKQGAAQIITLTGSDADSDTLTFIITADVNHGELYEVNDLNLTTPIASFPHALTAGDKNKVLFKHDNSTNFSPTFSFKANDGFEDSVAAATVTGTVTASNTLPVATAAQHPVNQGEAKIITLTGTDGDGDALKFKITSLPSNGTLHTVNTETIQSGFENIDAYYTSANQITSVPSTFLTQVVYKSGSGNYTQDTFQFKANDGKDDSSAAATITIPTNRKPVANLADFNFPRLGAQTITLTATDPDGDSISKYFLFDLINPTGQGAFRETATGPIITQNQMPYELPGNTFHYTNFNQSTVAGQSDLFVYQAMDSNGALSDPKTVQINLTAADVSDVFDGTGNVSISFPGHTTSSTFTTRFLMDGKPSALQSNNLTNNTYPRVEVGAGGITLEAAQYFDSGTNARRNRFFQGIVQFYPSVIDATQNTNKLFEIKRFTQSWTNGWGSFSTSQAMAFPLGDVDLPEGVYFVRIRQQIYSWDPGSNVGCNIILREKT